MTSMNTRERTTAAAERVTWRSVAVLAAVLLLPALTYALTVLVPFLASDLDRLPLTELAGGAQRSGRGGEGLQLAGIVALLLAALGALLALGGSALQLLAVLPSDRRTISPLAAAVLSAVAVCSAGVLLWFLSPLGSALTSWQLD